MAQKIPDMRVVGIAEGKAVRITRFGQHDIERTTACYPHAYVSSLLRLARVLDKTPVQVTYLPHKNVYTFVFDYDASR